MNDDRRDEADESARSTTTEGRRPGRVNDERTRGGRGESECSDVWPARVIEIGDGDVSYPVSTRASSHAVLGGAARAVAVNACFKWKVALVCISPARSW